MLQKKQPPPIKKRKIFDNIEIKIICLILAIVMWFYASRPEESAIVNKAISAISRRNRGIITLNKVPIKLEGLKEGVSATVNPSRISMDVICPLSAEVDITEIQAIVKLSNKDIKDKNRITLTEENVKLPEGLVFINAQPEEIQLSLKSD